MATITLDKLTKRFGRTEVIHGIDLAIADGEFVVFVGPSGCGKSTTLRMIAGLEEVSGGQIRIGDRVVNELDPKSRNIAMVFQNYAIYPHMTVRQNIGIGLYTSKLDKDEKARRVEEAAKLLGLEPFLERRPAALSGGQRQRVAMGRAMVRDPVAFLFDEPLSNLDAQLRAQMRIEIKALHQRLGSTIAYVTHDQVEAMTMADRIVVMRDGHILQQGRPMDIYSNPVDVFTARFIGTPSMNILAGGIEGDAPVARKGGPILLGVRPQDLLIGSAAGQVADTSGLTLWGPVTAVEPTGPETLVHFDVDGETVIGTAPGDEIPEVGARIEARAPAGAIHRFDASTKKALEPS
ncbi:ABC transporter ATP-binding protein [Wenxinia marina]|uniref:Carbohydrate ABC transporter ATP-binding protein, CUT1 family n=1 Tax=Wenxinia marina DSM 24838 TaxID=1123501 RepID=A0A0D0NHH6_9RHOB|nr:sn-glycerol-3-phosphate ABC transporter ATP-binding protein UgpC [Wenxinia marina]KIQ67775.1 carbohydrate ABC transporter ATP-binding protein, CUT1 family [Wenxinia marina DSM 24838]GGL77335.1 sugar ABC transporter ATP-binding protein [Wenxinia marina]